MEEETKVPGGETPREGNSSKFDQVKNTVADKLRGAAETLRQKATTSEIPGTMGNYGRQASSMLDRSADYIRDFDVERAEADVKNKVRQNPGASLMIAASIGFLLGVLVRRR